MSKFKLLKQNKTKKIIETFFIRHPSYKLYSVFVLIYQSKIS